MSIDKTITRLSRMAAGITAGDDLRRTHYTQAMGGSQWKTLQEALMTLQEGRCALTGVDMRRARADRYDSLTLHLLVPSAYWGTDDDKASTTARNGKALDPYRFGFVPGNVVLAISSASQMVKSEKATASLLQIKDSQHAEFWTPEMTRAAKVKDAGKRDDVRRELQAMGWMAEG